MSHRPLVFLSGLTVGDYLLWNWSLNGNHDVLALISGLTLPPLGLAWVWLLALGAARLLARFTRRSGGAAGRAAAARGATSRAQQTGVAAPMEEAAGPPARSAGRSSNKLAA